MTGAGQRPFPTWISSLFETVILGRAEIFALKI
jgi:hypothetical protein